jgi:hypothetical protein
MRRNVADAFAILCLLLFALSAFMWVRSYAVADMLRHRDSAGFEGILSSHGAIALFNYDWSGFAPKVEPGWSFQSAGPIDIAAQEIPRAAHHRKFIGFWFFRNTQLESVAGATIPGWCLVLPYWFFALLFSLVPLGRLLRLSARRSKKQ